MLMINPHQKEHAARLANWEIQTIEALAQESLDEANRKQFVRHQDRWLEKFIVDLQTDALDDRTVRLSIAKAAERLGIGNQHPPRIKELQTNPHDVANLDTSARWIRITQLVFTTPTNHEWRALHRELVTEHVEQERQTGIKWTPPDEGLGILEILEIEARRHELIGDEEAPLIDTTQAVRILTQAIARSVA